MPLEEAVGLVEVRGGDPEVATPALDERPAAPRADAVRDERPGGRPERAGQDGQPEVPRLSGDGLERHALADEEPGEGQHELRGDRDDDALDRHPQGDTEIPDRFVDLGHQVADRPVQEVEHGRQHSRLSSAR